MKLKLYLLISLIIHLLILFFSPEFQNKERLKGKKIVPIELINNKSFNSAKGNSNQNSLNKQQKKIKDKNNEMIKTEKKSEANKKFKSNEKEEIFKGDFNIKNKEINKKSNKLSDKKPLLKEKKLDNTKFSKPQKKGFASKADKKDLEKGSIKGKGKLKITCLDCILPKYPRKALNKGIEGKLTVKVWVLTNGNVDKAEIIISSGISSIDNAALEAAEKSKFYPIPYKSFINIEYDLKLK